MDVRKKTHTATSYPTLHSAPLNQFSHARYLPKPHDKSVVHPNVDCLRSSAWLDLSRDFVVLSIPKTVRHYLLTFFSGWYEIFDTSSPRTTGTEGCHLAFVAPHWHGKLPAGLKRVVAPSEIVWIDGWFEADGPEDIELVRRLQDQFQLTPLSEWGTTPVWRSLPYPADVDQKTTAEAQVAALDARSFYSRLSRLMRKNPAPQRDAASLAEFADIGFVASEDFVFELLPSDTTQAMYSAVPAALATINNAEKAARSGEKVDNWSLHAHPARYENYLDRAVAARSGIETLAEDILCYQTAADHTGESLKGTHQYVIHFSSDQIPPVNAFWSITVYDEHQHLVSNSIHRNAISDRNRLKFNSDRSLSVYLQHDWPTTTKDSNWLPCPRHSFNLALRMYWPKPDAFAGNWRPPAVMRTN
jgi:hypothetical protein